MMLFSSWYCIDECKLIISKIHDTLHSYCNLYLVTWTIACMLSMNSMHSCTVIINHTGLFTLSLSYVQLTFRPAI